MPDSLPHHWTVIAVGGDRPLHEGGYTATVCEYSPPPDSSRTSSETLRARIGTVGRRPREHTFVVEPHLCSEPTDTTTELSRIATDSVPVSDPSSKHAQRAAEARIWNYAVTHLQSLLAPE